jgi:hypothetical protein
MLSALLACTAAVGECVLSGEVMHNGNPVPGAEILEDLNSGPVSLGQTNLEGQFRVNPSPVPPRWSKAILLVRMAGFDQLTMGAPPGIDRCPKLTETTLALSGSPTAGASTTGTNLFVAPYQLSGSSASQEEIDRFNATLILAIYNKVTAFRSQLEQSTSGPLPEMGVMPLTAKVSFTDPEGVRAVGAQVNALGVITGLAERAGAAGTPQSVRLSSEFRVIPRYPAYQEYHIQISDDLPGPAIDPVAISERLQDLWGKRATIALLVRALSVASDAHDKAQQQVVRSWIIALRGKLGPDETHLARELDGLKADVESELRK